MHHVRALWIGLVAVLAFGCGAPLEFHSSIDQSGRTPWTHLDFHNQPESFQFAIIGDLAGGFRPEIFRKAVAQLNTLQPEFVMSVGDLIETWPEGEDVRIDDPDIVRHSPAPGLGGPSHELLSARIAATRGVRSK